MKTPRCAAVVVAAGSSRRMGFDKLFADLKGKPVLAWSLEAFAHHPDVSQVIAVTAQQNREAIADWRLAGEIVGGGKHRHESVWRGLQAVAPETELVAVHDGARPLIRAESITACLNLAQEHGAAACARRITDTVKRAGPDGRVCASVERENLWAMETPQCFQIGLLIRAYEEVLARDLIVTDEVSAVEALGEAVYLAENPWPNPKITFASDLDQVRACLQ